MKDEMKIYKQGYSDGFEAAKKLYITQRDKALNKREETMSEKKSKKSKNKYGVV